MPRKGANQWDFGELFPAQTLRRVFSVTELTSRIKGLIEEHLGAIWVSGEITNLRVQGSGHIYFSLKDANAVVSCVLFRGTATGSRGELKDGQKVVLQGDLTVYEPRGQYQLVVRFLELQGIGVLQAAFERLKSKLAAEGLFDPGRKRPLPRFPRRVGIVTSQSGAALHDVLHVIERRYARLELWLAPCRVQGQGAEFEIAEAIRRLNAWSALSPTQRLDAILVTRGGGSLEDIWAFNEEVVARAIHESQVPVISAIGHEIDFTIADFVADLRAATPSAAAELLTAGYVDSREIVARHGLRLRRLMVGILESWGERLTELLGRLVRGHPRRRLNERMQRLDDLQTTLLRRGRELLRSRGQRLESLKMRLAGVRPAWRLGQWQTRLEKARRELSYAKHREMHQAVAALDRLKLRLRLLSPEHVLARGYSITLDAATGQVLRRAEETTPGQLMRTRLQSGHVTSVVARAEPAEDAGPATSEP